MQYGSLMNASRNVAVIKVIAATFVFLFMAVGAEGQALSVLPVNIFFPQGQRTAVLTITNQGNSSTSVQIRAYAWSQRNGEDHLADTDAVLASPPIATIAPGDKQVVRLILRELPQEKEATYRILVDQIPPPAEPGVVHVVLRMSIPIFAQPAFRAACHVDFHVEREAAQLFLVGVNDCLRHEAIRDIALSTSDGQSIKTGPGELPYVLAGATRRWPLAALQALSPATETLHLTAHSDTGAIDEQVRVVPAP